ncbi:MAG: hypothetical protein QOD75_2295 [Blastocatellia bacterium]|nr:hypothetical protein [Blastocatellia bacterium]
MIGKAVTLSEALARSDRGPLPRIKEMMKSLAPDEVSEEISRALDQMNQELVRDSGSLAGVKKLQRGKKDKTAKQRREAHLTHGVIELFSGLGLMIFLYFMAGVLALKLPEHFIAEVPFEIEPVVKMIWLIGLVPALTGVGRILAGLAVQPDPPLLVERAPQSVETSELPRRLEPASITDRTTNILNREP